MQTAPRIAVRSQLERDVCLVDGPTRGDDQHRDDALAARHGRADPLEVVCAHVMWSSSHRAIETLPTAACSYHLLDKKDETKRIETTRFPWFPPPSAR